MRGLLLAAASILAIVSTGCTGSVTGGSADGLDQIGQSTAGIQLSGLELLDGSMLDRQSSNSISLRWSADGRRAEIVAEDVVDLKALYFSVEHATALSAGVLEAGDWAEGSSLSLALTPQPGHTEAGVVLLNPDKATGFSGSGVLASLELTGAEAARTASAPPLTEASRTTLYLAPNLGQFYWFYKNQGDYDQNGEVNISDLTPLAIHFGKAAQGGEFDFSSVESVVDGDGNGEINISDISPIGSNYGNSIDSYDLYLGSLADYPENPGDPLGGAQIANWPRANAGGDPADMRLLFNETLQLPLPPTSGAWLIPLSGGAAGIASTKVGFGNQSPVADLQITSQTGVVPFTCSADASGSSDPDGDELSFTWLFGDELNIFVSIGKLFNPADQGTQFSTEVDVQGAYKLLLIVRDPQGAVDLVFQDVLAADEAGWQVVDLDMGERHSSIVELQDVDICEVDGTACIGYSYATGGGSQVYLMQADSLLDDSWQLYDFVHAQSGVDFSEVAVAEIDGTCAIAASMDRGTAGEAVFARQIESGEYGLFNTKLFEQPSGALSGIDMANVNGQAMIAYRNNATGELRFCVAIDEAAQNILGPVNVAITGAPSSQISLKEVDGAPAFCYWAGPNSFRLRYHSAVMNGPLPVFDSGTTLRILNSGYLSDALVVLNDGSPAVFYGIPTETAIYGLRAADPQASTWNDLGEVSQQNTAIVEYCAGLHGGRPAILWYDLLAASLYYQRAEDASGSSWGPAELIDDSLALGARPCMAEVRGIPVIAYIDKGRNLISYGVYVE